MKKVFDLIHRIDFDRLELAIYKLKNMARTWFDQWKEGREQDAAHPSWDYFEEDSWCIFSAKNGKRERYESFTL